MQYLAGLWSHGLLDQLLWSPRATEPPQDVGYIAPSWSWASQTEPIVYKSRPYAPHIADGLVEILHVTTEPRADPLDQVLGGFWRVRGAMCEIKFDFRTESSEDISNAIVISTVLGYQRILVDDTSFEFDNSDADREAPFYLLRFYDNDDVQPEGLILRPTTENDQYRHIGIFDLTVEDVDKHIREILSKAFHTIKLNERLYEDFDGIDKYTVSIC